MIFGPSEDLHALAVLYLISHLDGEEARRSLLRALGTVIACDEYPHETLAKARLELTLSFNRAKKEKKSEPGKNP